MLLSTAVCAAENRRTSDAMPRPALPVWRFSLQARHNGAHLLQSSGRNFALIAMPAGNCLMMHAKGGGQPGQVFTLRLHPRNQTPKFCRIRPKHLTNSMRINYSSFVAQICAARKGTIYG